MKTTSDKSVTKPDKLKKISTDDSTFGYSAPEKLVAQIAHLVVLLLSLVLIVFISYDTFTHIPFLTNHVYMTFQFWVCVVFLLDFFIELSFSPNKKRYFASRWFFLIISIPYLNIIQITGLQLDENALYFIRFIPLIRGAYSMAMVVGFFSTNRAFTILSQYAFILLSAIYFMSMIFYYEERSVNTQVLDYWDALYWAFLNVTTVGSEIEAVTLVGKVGTVLMALSGMMMLPLFTVYVTDRVKRLNDRQRQEKDLLLMHLHHDETSPAQASKESPKPSSDTTTPGDT